MPTITVLDTATLSLSFETPAPAAPDGSFQVTGLSFRTASGLVTALPSTVATIQVQKGATTTWNFGAPIEFHFGPAELALHAGARQAASAGWQKLRVEIGSNRMQLAFSGLRLASDSVPGLPLEGDANLVFENGGLRDETSIVLRQPAASGAELTAATLARIALEWTAAGTAEMPLPGLRVTPPPAAKLGLILDSSAGSPQVSLELAATAPQVVSARSGFAWLRDASREIHPAENGDAAPGLLSFSAKTLSAASLTLLRFEPGKLDLPVFLTPSSPGAFETTFSVNPVNYKFPFLKRDGQFVEIASFNAERNEITVNFEAGGLKVAGLKAVVPFDQETFTATVDHDAGIELRGPRTLAIGPHLGLNWKLETDEPGAEDAHWFTLVTRNSHYQIQLAPTARIVLEYSQATREGEPIRFVASKFALGEAGVSLTAEVQDDPARLNGIDTRFTFHGTRLEIVEDRIQDFTLTGSGPLPPDLVGDATADIALQFEQRGGALSLVAGAAELKGTGLLEAKSTHFTFKVDALGLKFVDDHGYHLYFTVTGSATYVPEPFDEDNDPLHFLSSATIELVECPLTGDATVLARHINFLVEFNEPVEFKFLGAFTFELRAIGFLCSVEQFDGDAALQLTGQVMFSPEGKDTKSAKVDFHGLLIGAPAPGDLLPRIHLDTLAVEIEYGDAFHLSGEVEFRNSDTEKGFLGEGLIEIKGMPSIAASFAFLRVRLDEESNWVSAWFIFLEVRKVSFQIPVVEIYLREVGLGFGYRFTLTSIKTADAEKDLGKLIGALRELSRTAGDLSKRDRWAVDLENRGEDPRWTIAFRAMFSQTSASTLLKYNDAAEKELPCVFLFDAVAAIRSDLTFFMAARGWINTNYNDFLENRDLSEKPIVSGFVILSPRQKRLLAHVASNPEGSLGTRPEVPEFVANALAKAEFSATLLIEPGLFHFELGWPNMLRWSQSFGPLNVEFRGGFIYRVTERELVIGISFQARASLDIVAEVNLVVVGAKLEASMRAALGARLLAVTSLTRQDDVAVYAAIGLDVRIAIRLTLWVGIDLGFVRLTKDFTFSLTIGFTAGLEVGLRNASIGIQGSGTISVEVMGHSLHFSASFEKNAGAVIDARERTSPYLKLGLEATEVEDVPGIPGGGPAEVPAPAAPAVTAAEQVAATRRLENAPAASTKPVVVRAAAGPAGEAPPDREGAFHAPDYVVFVMHKPAADGRIYCLLMPKGENERGFLPAPPADIAAAGDDFELTLPASGKPAGFERFDPFTGGFVAVGEGPVAWKAGWNAAAISPEGADPVKLADYLRHAFLMKRPLAEGGANVAVGDPEPLSGAAPVEDDRVQNPTDSAFEAAVRGAVEQFRGSPLFKRDPAREYDRALGDAFNPGTSLYMKTSGDKVVYDPDAEHAVQFRGVVVHDLVEDFRADVLSNGTGIDRAKSIPFQMGLVFRMDATGIPAWVTDLVPDAALRPKIRQRIEGTLSGEKTVSAFNIAAARFDKFPPQFERVRQYTSSNTIALAWDLVWEQRPGDTSGHQSSPEHHLRNYEVRRRALDGGEREVVYTVKNASSLNLKQGGVLQALRPRFKVVDNFNEESREQQAALPESGRSYLYSITPCDVAGNLGRPLTLVATRFPDEPPAVPAESTLTVAYRFAETPPAIVEGDTPQPAVHPPAAVAVTWRDPVHKEGPLVPIRTHRLIFRRSATLPAGSYAFDAVSSGARTSSLPTSNARALPSDIKVDLESITGPRDARRAEVPLARLRAAGILPAEDGRWRPEAWSVFFQTESANGVPSALAPVQVLLRFAREAADKAEERRPEQLEFLPGPVRLPLLPPEDMNAITGTALFPMPKASDSRFGGTLANVEFRDHPEGTRGIRFRWNQAPSARPGYEPRLHAGYSILELNIDANTEQTFNDRQLLADALWTVQEVRMLPAHDLLLAPGNTLATSQWEAWYPSAVARRQRSTPLPPGSEAALGAWFSSRESYLEWPPRLPGQATFLHTDLVKIVDELRKEFLVDLQVAPPVQEMTLDDLLRSTAPGPDPYGWGVLQRFGLSCALSLRRKNSGEIVSGAALLAAVQSKLALSGASLKHLYVELLFQPSNSMSFDAGAPPSADALLGIVQLSLRPAVVQFCRYYEVTVKGTPGLAVTLHITPFSSTTLLNPLDPAAGEVRLEPRTTPVTRTVRIPMTGTLSLLLRAEGRTGAAPGVAADAAGVVIEGPSEFAPTDDRSAAFTAPVDLLAQAFLRPSRYFEATVNGAPNAGVTLKITPHSRTTLLDPAAGEVEFAAAPAPVAQPVRLPASGRLTVLLRAEGTAGPAPEIGSDDAGVTIEGPAEFPPTDERAARFTADPASSWLRFKLYAESLNSNQRTPEKKIAVPVDPAGMQAILPAVISWSARFFEGSGAVAQRRTAPGPWVATAYPRSTAQVFATPDESGRLTHDYLLTDSYAHNFRYYIRPFGRYDLLWRTLLQSPLLFQQAGSGVLPPETPDPARGGLDVVLHRTQPVAMPVVLKSGRLDAQPKLGAGDKPAPAPPGATWEVIVARHPEQTLAERNQTVFRQLSYRGLAFTLLRKFAYQRNATALERAVGNSHVISIANIRDIAPEAPGALPPAPDHLDLTSLTPAQARTLDLPLRLGSFQQGAMALQWEGLPFYYEHRLLLIAQASSVVSPVNEVTQRDFEYRSPEPVCRVEGIALAGDKRLRRITVPLRMLWDSLPREAQLQWPVENPASAEGARPDRRKPGSIPDLDVIYQVVHIFNGNVEVQAELFANPALLSDPEKFVAGPGNPPFQFRQLGKSFLVEGGIALGAPAAAPVSGDYTLTSALLQVTTLTLRHAYALERIPPATRSKLAIRNGNELSIQGVLRPDDVVRILLPEFSGAGVAPGPAALPRPSASIDDPGAFPAWRGFYRQFYATRLSSGPFDFAALGGKLDFPLLTPQSELPAILLDRLTLTADSASWSGTITNEELEALERFAAALPEHRIHKRLVSGVFAQHVAHSQDITSPYPLTTRPLPGTPLPEGLTINVAAAVAEGGQEQQAWELRWNGAMSDARVEELLALPGDADFQRAVRDIVGRRPNPETSFAATAAAAFREPAARVQRSALFEVFTGRELDSIVVPPDDGGTENPDLVYRWRGHAPLPLPASVYKARVDARFGATDPRFVELFGNFIDKVAAEVGAPRTTAQSAPAVPPLVRCAGRLSAGEAAQLRTISENDGEIEELIKDVEDRRTLEDVANNWFSVEPVSSRPATTPAELADLMGLVDFPEPTQCTLVWKGALDRPLLNGLTGDAAFLAARDEILRARPESLPAEIGARLAVDAAELRWTGPPPSAAEEAALRTLTGDAEFNAAVGRLIAAIPAGASGDEVTIAPMPDVVTGVAPVGLDQPPAALEGKIAVTGDGSSFTAVRWIADAPMLDADLLALRRWPALAAFTSALDAVARVEVEMLPEQSSPFERPRPTQSDLPSSLRTKLTIEPQKLTWTGRIRDASHLVMLKALRGDEAFQAAAFELAELLSGKPEIALGAVPVRPRTSGQLLVGRASIRYHGLMTRAECTDLQGLYDAQADKDAISRLFDASSAKGLQGSQLMVRTRRGSAAPSAMAPLTAERPA